MRAVGYQEPRSISEAGYLVDIERPEPRPLGRDLLVEVKAVSVNPVDYKARRRAIPDKGEWNVLGWDVAGTVAGVGPDVTLFKVGDEVFYAGDISRPGGNSERHLIDERIVGRKPQSLSFVEAAALPLTAITGWEVVFDRLDVKKPVPGVIPSILIIGGAGGVASITIQLVRQLTDLKVIATASRPESKAWVTNLGAHHVIDHSKPLAREIEAQGIEAPGFVFSTTNSDDHAFEIAKLIAPQGRFALIDNPASIDIVPFKPKSVSIHWEMMFTRPMFQTSDMAGQGDILNQVSRLVDAGKIKTTLGEVFGKINAENLTRAHAALETGRTKGKIVLEGFDAIATP